MLSVVIPTHNRCAILADTLARLLAQQVPKNGFELIVVDNGSTDDTPALLSYLQRKHSERLRALREPAPGPAAARNAGGAAARGELLMFVGDDMAPGAADLLERHVALHSEHPASEYAVLGKVEWSDRCRVTPLMRWLQRGPQFSFERLTPGPVDAAVYFCTAQVSLKRTMFESVGAFDIRFPYAAVEDIELGVRLAARGATLDYRPELVVRHTHPISLADWLTRMRTVGRSAALLEQLHPAKAADSGAPPPRGFKYGCVSAAAPLMAPLGRATDHTPLRRLRWRILHHAAYAEGFREGLRGIERPADRVAT